MAVSTILLVAEHSISKAAPKHQSIPTAIPKEPYSRLIGAKAPSNHLQSTPRALPKHLQSSPKTAPKHPQSNPRAPGHPASNSKAPPEDPQPRTPPKHTQNTPRAHPEHPQSTPRALPEHLQSTPRAPPKGIHVGHGVVIAKFDAVSAPTARSPSERSRRREV